MSHTNTKPEQNAAQHVQTGLPAAPDAQPQGFIDRYAKILVVVAVLCGATSGNFGALISAPASVTGFWRLLLALPFFAVPIFAKEESRRKLFAVSKKNLLLAFLSGAFLFGHFFTWYTAVKSTNVASAAVLASFHPLIVIFITVFIYHKKVSGKSIAAILVALGGGALIMCSDLSAFTAGGQLSGNLLAFAAGLCMGVYFAFGGKVRREVDGSISVLLIFTSCWICFTLSNIIPGTPLLGYPPTDYLYMICLTFICQIGSHAVWNLCMGHVSSLYVSTWETSDPVFATLLAVIMVKQIPSTTEIIGCVIVVAALLMYNKFERESEQAHV